MSEIILKVNNLSKKYCRDLKRSMMYGCFDIIKDALAIPTNHNKLRKNEFWSVSDISFDLKRGECIGIIGPNGAGKSTLLKMLNGIIKPDKGSISYKGRMGALIEVGAGFQPILTGRENIYINGSILGLSKTEIDRQFNNIVEFSGLEEFLDTPVKNYSSGMRVRLGFSIAAHLDPDILLVDEVLAVGDLAFQAKCRNRIMELVNRGTSIIFISHNMNLVNHLCSSVIVLQKGKAIQQLPSIEAIDKYKEICSNFVSKKMNNTGEVIIESIETFVNENKTNKLNPEEDLCVHINYNFIKCIDNPVFVIYITNSEGIHICSIRSNLDDVNFGTLHGKGTIEIVFPKINLLPNTYNLNFAVLDQDSFSMYCIYSNAKIIQVIGGHNVDGVVILAHKWNKM